MKDTPKVSVVIPTYNRASYIGEAIQSVLNQTYQDFELIVVDDGSTDNTGTALDQFGERIRVLYQQNSGVSVARNKGTFAARGEWVAFLDSDDEWEPEKLRVQIEDVKKHEGVVAHFVDAQFDDKAHKKQSLFSLKGVRLDFEKQPLRIRAVMDVLRGAFFTQCCLVKRKVILAVGGFDPNKRIYEDYDLLTRIALEGAFFVNCYIGTIVKGCQTGESNLSLIHLRSPVEARLNLLNTYTRLKKDPRLNTAELRWVCRFLGGLWCELSRHYLRQHDWRLAFHALRSSLRDDPNIRSIIRAFWVIASSSKLVDRISRQRNLEIEVRRSSMMIETER
jgi:glycosyltransferase involved in cell wall biosynthesis